MRIIYPNRLPDPREDRPRPNPNRNPIEWVVSVEDLPKAKSKGKQKRRASRESEAQRKDGGIVHVQEPGFAPSAHFGEMLKAKKNASAWIQTFSGVAFYPLEPRIEDIRIEDIAHGLAGDNRFGCQMRQRYNTAQHSVMVSILCPEHALHALLHDASEAYLRDIPRPIKHTPVMAGYREAEHRLQSMIYERFGLSSVEPPEVKKADNWMLGIEARDLMQPLVRPEEWEWAIGPIRDNPVHIGRCWSPEEAEVRFLERFDELTILPPASVMSGPISVSNASSVLGRRAADARRIARQSLHQAGGLFEEVA